jgi:hypothetical protein
MVDQAGGAIDHPRARACPATDDLDVGDHRAQPVGKVDHLRAADAREKVLVAAENPAIS